MADFMHSQGVDHMQWRYIRSYIRNLASVEEALRFSKWPAALEAVVIAILMLEFNHGTQLIGDQTVLERAAASTVDVPGALAEYISVGKPLSPAL